MEAVLDKKYHRTDRSMLQTTMECRSESHAKCYRGDGNDSLWTPLDPNVEMEILSSLDEKQFEILIPSFIIVLLAILIGIPGNVITVIVYKKRMRRTASRIFILALAFCDLMNCIITMPAEISIIVNFFTYEHPIICSIGRALTYILNGVSALLLCGIAVDRFRKICRPLKPVFTPKKTRAICFVASAIGFAFYIPAFILYGTQTVRIEHPYGDIYFNITGHTCQINDKYKNTKIQKYILGIWFLATIIIMVILIVVYARIGRAVYKRLKLEEKRHYSVSTATKPARRKMIVDHSSETSCSFEDVLEAERNDQPKVLKSMSMPLRHKIGDGLRKQFRLSAPTVYSLNKETVSRRIRAGRTTLMLFSVTIAYVLSFIPFVAIVTIRTMKPDLHDSLSDVQKSVWNFFLRSYVINCAVNPILYGFFNKDFRKKMIGLFTDCC
ncbi:cholecystokinin receptor type A-like [Mercenaria mercenaria]|uniref:cholecystokinin receptor type A-like n=1 Tax=Mercenaria mercenaria TaxID=6596 RepID=UPI00234EF481|nr:cholecystokinin receptor type A-like [Mercenaria mercenaria]